MDLCAYMQIDDIDEIARKNNIEVPRLRGYRLMKDEKPINISDRVVNKRQTKQLELWNKYAGREDILYIHARIGGNNWSRYHDQVDTKPWFLEKVDDSFDSTYCDIYARIETEDTKNS